MIAIGTKPLTSEEIDQLRELLRKDALRGRGLSEIAAEAEVNRVPDPAIAANPITAEEVAAQAAVDEAKVKWQAAVDELWRAQNPAVDESDRVFDGAFGMFHRSSKRRAAIDPVSAQNALEDAYNISSRANARLTKLQQERSNRTWTWRIEHGC